MNNFDNMYLDLKDILEKYLSKEILLDDVIIEIFWKLDNLTLENAYLREQLNILDNRYEQLDILDNHYEY